MDKPRSLSGDTLGYVLQDVERLAVQAQTYRQLFGTEDGIRAVNAVAQMTFGVIQKSLQETMLLGVTRILLDPPAFGKNENLGLHSVILYGSDENDPLRKRLADLKERFKEFKTLRNKLYAHRDMIMVNAVAYRRQPSEDGIRDIDVLEAIDEVVALWKDYFRRDGASMEISSNNDVSDLINALNSKI